MLPYRFSLEIMYFEQKSLDFKNKLYNFHGKNRMLILNLAVREET